MHFDIQKLEASISNYTAGNIKNYRSRWEEISPNFVSMQIVKQGLTIDFIDNTPPPITNKVKQCVFAPTEINNIDLEIVKLL